MSDASLYRMEAVRARFESRATIRLRPQMSAWISIGVACALVAGLLAYCAFGTITRKVTVSGTLVPSTGLISIEARQVGTIDSLLVAEGGFDLFAYMAQEAGCEIVVVNQESLLTLFKDPPSDADIVAFAAECGISNFNPKFVKSLS